jgi:SAM-dependent methyltransferase
MTYEEKAMSSVHIPYETQDIKWFEYEQRWKIKCVELLNHYVASGVRNGTKVFDFGCGRGEFLNLLMGNGYKAEGGDFDPNCVKLSSRFAPSILLSDSELDRFINSNAYDVVCAIHVLEHLRDPTSAVENFKKMTRRYLLLAVPNLQSTAYICLRRSYPANEGHISGWDYPHFENFLRRICHLDIIEMTGDTVPFTTKLSKVDVALEKLLGRSVIRKLENGPLLRRFPYLSHSILALCKIN